MEVFPLGVVVDNELSEFEKICTIWRLIHDQKELLE